MKKQQIIKVIVIIAVLLIPIMYSFFYLKAYWDPYGNLKDIKIAMVNLDKGKNGENQGKKLVNTMIENGTFTICDVSEDDADKGLVNSEYYAVIKIPSTFSENLNSASSSDKKISTITYSPNQKSNFLASQIINSAVKTIELNLQSQVAEKITETLADNLNSVPKSLDEISEGTGELLDGTFRLKSGIRSLADGSKVLRSGTSDAYNGALQIKNQVASSTEKLVNDNSDALDNETITKIGKQAEKSATLSEDKKNEIGNQAKQTALQSIELNSSSIGEEALETAVKTISNQSNSIGNTASEIAIQTISNQSSSIGSNASEVAIQTISNQSDSIGNSASELATQTIEKQADEIGANATKLASQSINAKVDTIGKMAVQTADESINTKLDFIGNSAKQNAENTINNQLGEIGNTASAEAVATITGMLDEISGKAKQEALTDVSTKLEFIGNSASTTAVGSLNKDQIDAKIQTILESNENYTALPPDLQLLFSATTKAIAWGTAQEVASNVANQTAKSTATEVTSSVADGVSRKIAVSVAGTVANQTAQSTAKEVAGEVASQTAQSTAKQVAGEVASQTAQSTAKQVAGEVASQTAQNTAKQVAGKVASQTAQSTAKQVAGEVASQTAQSTAKQVAGEVASQTAQSTAKQVAGEIANQTAQIVAKEVTGQVSETVAKTVASQTAIQVAGQTAQIVAKDVSNEVKRVALTTMATQMGPLQDGLGKLSDGLGKLNSGTTDLVSGAEQLSEGSEELEKGVYLLKSSVDDGNVDTKKELKKLDGIAKFANNPVDIKEVDYGKVSAYGISFLPLFISIGLWVGTLMLYVVLYYDQENRFKLLGRYAENKFLQIGLYFALSVAQGIITGILLKAGLNFTVTSYGLYYFSCILISAVFLSIIQFLVMAFGDVGKFLALIILVLQLASAGGTFPVQTVSKGFQLMNPYLPMTYTIKLIKEAVISTDSGFALRNILVLSIYLIISLGLTLCLEKYKQSKKEEKTNI